ncbi:MAG: response regulator, partial [Gemmatimonadota bacterium]
LAARPAAGEVLAAIHRELTRLEDSAVRCGRQDVADLTIALEARVERWREDALQETAERGPAVLHFAAELRTRLEQATSEDRQAALRRALATLDAVEAVARTIVDIEPTVLVVDSCTQRFEALRAALATLPVKLVHLESTALLDQAIERHQPLVVWLNANGDRERLIAQIAALRLLDPHRLTSIVVSGGSNKAALRPELFAAGADDFLLTPLAADEVRSRIGSRVERQRLQRIASELHPATALPVGDRVAAHATEALIEALENDLPCAVLLLRGTSWDARGESADRWDREMVRLARALGKDAAVVGYDDPVTMLALLRLESREAAELIQTLHANRPPDAPQWHAAIVSARELGARDLTTLRTTAAEVLSSNRRANDPAVVVWNPQLAGVTPDVIIVEDDTTMREMLSFALRERAISHVMYADGAAALEALLTLHPTRKRPIVLLDIDLPGIDGFSLFEDLRVQRPGAFEFVFATVRTSEADQVRALGAGALDYVRKPLNVRLLMAKIEHWLARTHYAL